MPILQHAVSHRTDDQVKETIMENDTHSHTQVYDRTLKALGAENIEPGINYSRSVSGEL